MKRVTQYFRRQRSVVWALAVLLLLAQIFGCAYGKVRHSSIEPGNIEDFIDKNYENFEIAYSGTKDRPAAIRFDVKDDNVVLTGRGWYPIADRAQLHEMFRYMIASYRFWEGIFRGPYLFLILDKNDRTIGYYYSILENEAVRPDGENYRLDPVTEEDIREQLRYPSIRGAGA